MGIQDRDYYREDSRGFFDAWGRQGATAWIIIITSVVFFGQCINGHPLSSPLVEAGAYSQTKVLEGEVWRMVTPLFLHASLFHLVCNMLILYVIGSRLEELYGSREFLTFYLVSGTFAQSFYLLAQVAAIAPPNLSVGASGAVTALMLLFAFHFPRQQMLLFMVIPVPIWALVVLYIAIDIFGTVGMRPGAGVAHFVHLGGALFGAAYYQLGFRFHSRSRRSPRRPERRAKPKLRIVPVDPEDNTPTPVGAAVESAPRPKEVADEQLEARLDQVLEKVSKYGQESLTPDERAILVRASELYKKRRK